MRNEDIARAIMSEIDSRGRITSKGLGDLAGISRQAAHKRLSIMVGQRKLSRTGATRGAYYERYSPDKERRMRRGARIFSMKLKNEGLQEHLVLERIEKKSSLLEGASECARHIFSYAFTEMLNNAIEHSRSDTISVKVYATDPRICFDVVDRGIGVYNNLRRKYRVGTELEAIQELLKGKRTTAPKKHSGEGIFFTEKISDTFELDGGKSRLMIDNMKNDIAVKEAPRRRGTKVSFAINKRSRKSLTKLFSEYTDQEYRFSKTKVTVKLYEKGVDFVSRSQARRVLYGLEEFKTITLDFRKIKGIGQGFADEVFRVYGVEHPRTEIIPKNASKTVMFMIQRAKA